MEEQEEPWKELNENLYVDRALQIHVDTRDFYATFNFTENKEIKDLPTLLKYKGAFFFTIEEVYSLVKRLYLDSGGKAEWRMLTFVEDGNWFKYLRIFKTDYGYLIGTNFRDEYKFYRRSFWLSATVNQEHLHTH